jgi:hypothetical protein
MQPTYRRGKKFIGSQEIGAKHRLIFYASDGCTINTATLWVDGTASCNCPGWRFHRKCKHSARALNLTATVDETGGPDRSTSAAPEEPPRGTTPFKRRTRSVDT